MKHPRRVGTVLGLITAGLAATSATAAASPEFWVYFGTYTDATSKGIYVSRLDANGRLTAPQLAAEGPNPAFLAVDPRHRFLYAAHEVGTFGDEHAGFLSAYAIDAMIGKLTLLNQVSTVTSGPAHVSVDAASQVVFAANYGGSSVESFPVRTDGSLGAAASVIRQQGSSVNPARQQQPHAHCVGVDPNNRFVLLCDLGLDQVLVFKLDADNATLTPNDSPFVRGAPGAGPRHFAFRPDGKFVYVINELDCTLAVFAYDPAHGVLAPVETVSTLPPGESVQPGYSTAEVAVHPSGRFLYGSNRGHNSIAVFAIDAETGRLSPVEHVSSGGERPRSFAIDPTGHFLLSANQDTNNIVVMRIDQSTGKLTPTGDAVSIARPVCVVFAPVQ